MEELNKLYITKKQVVQTISDFLEPTMNKYGFKWIKSNDEFIKKNNEWSFHILLNTKNFWPLLQEFNIHISVVNKEINKIRMLFFSNAKIDNYTVSKWLVLPNSNELRYKELYTINDIEIAKKEAYDLIKNEAFIYLEKYSKLENIIEEKKILNNDYNMSILLISSKLSNDIRYNIFKDEIIKYIQSNDFKYEGVEKDIKSLLSLINYLDNL